MKTIRLFSFVITILLFLTMVVPVFAATPPPSAANQGVGCGGGFGPIAEFFCGISSQDTVTQKAATGTRLNKVISSIVGFLTIIAALWFFIQIILAGYNWISAGGDSEKTAAAWAKIYNSIIGLIIVVAAWVIVGLIGKLIGLDIMNPGDSIQNLTF